MSGSSICIKPFKVHFWSVISVVVNPANVFSGKE